MAKKGHSVNYLDTIGIKNIPPSIHAISAQLPQFVIPPTYWINQNTAATLPFTYRKMDICAGILIQNHTLTVCKFIITVNSLLICQIILTLLGTSQPKSLLVIL